MLKVQHNPFAKAFNKSEPVKNKHRNKAMTDLGSPLGHKAALSNALLPHHTHELVQYANSDFSTNRSYAVQQYNGSSFNNNNHTHSQYYNLNSSQSPVMIQPNQAYSPAHNNVNHQQSHVYRNAHSYSSLVHANYHPQAQFQQPYHSNSSIGSSAHKVGSVINIAPQFHLHNHTHQHLHLPKPYSTGRGQFSRSSMQQSSTNWNAPAQNVPQIQAAYESLSSSPLSPEDGYMSSCRSGADQCCPDADSYRVNQDTVSAGTNYLGANQPGVIQSRAVKNELQRIVSHQQNPNVMTANFQGNVFYILVMFNSSCAFGNKPTF